MHKAPLGLFSIEKVNLNKRIEQTLVRKLALSCLFDNSFNDEDLALSEAVSDY